MAVKRFNQLTEMGGLLEIKNFLYEQGIQGTKGSSHNCPIAKYVRGDSDLHVWIQGYNSIISGIDPREEVLWSSIPVRQFIRYFDAGLFPDMIEQEK